MAPQAIEQLYAIGVDGGSLYARRFRRFIVFAHGGGFVFCDLDTHDELCRAMTNGVGAIVVSVDYRLAPESPWPSAVQDVYAVTTWAAQDADELGGDPARLLIAGDSAGGNLATVTAQLARDRGRPAIAGQLLVYPVVAADFDTASYRDHATGFYNTAAAMGKDDDRQSSG